MKDGAHWLSEAEIDAMLENVLPPDVWNAYRKRTISEPISRYVDLLGRWNSAVSLTSERQPARIVQRHVAESLCCATVLPMCESMLDLGSGAGFPGILVQLMRPETLVTLAESHGRKAAFLREAIRELGLPAKVFAGRAQLLPDRSFACVCLRAVDPIRQALRAASALADASVCLLGSASMQEVYTGGLAGWQLSSARPSVQGGSNIYQFGRTPEFHVEH